MEFDSVLYTPIVDRILRSSELASISAKDVRKLLQKELGYDISEHKTQVTELVKERFDLILDEAGAENIQPVKKESNGYDDDDDDSHVKKEGSRSSSSKKRKSVAGPSSVDDDARLAAKLQAEWNSQDRPSRSSTVKRKAVAPRKKKKSSATISDDSGAEEGGEKKKKRKINANNPFHRPLILSPQLSTLLGETQLSRPETVKRIWAYIRENGLQDQSDKRYIICDESLRTVFPTPKVHMFTMNKILSGHLYPINGADAANVKLEDLKSEDIASSPVSAAFSHQGSPSSVESEAS
ncbi:hypothetical protein H072_6883 [Dactylellina haptotyla CBS 200.50]|uniref:Uncharacterized protein n=1 Tax=Dactylellina haptotyla (strain CBS 200.50) TaxID=1284197 RepID=S8BVN9_DACHA|nr:hypothetical protein H072_6883 [Dactylellina haptotyla CBS 200.50]